MPDEPYVMPSWEDAAQVDTVTTAGTAVPCIGSWINTRVCERGTVGCEVAHEPRLPADVFRNPPTWGDDVEDEWTEAIKAAHPTRNGSHETYATAMRMVGARRSKGALVELVNWLLQR